LLLRVEEVHSNQQDATISIRLGSITHYFNYLKKQGDVKGNPVKQIRIKGAVKRVIENPLSTDELQALYDHYRLLKKVSIHQHNTRILPGSNQRLAYKRLCYSQLGKTAQYAAGTIYGWAQAYKQHRKIRCKTWTYYRMN
jgi:hypothetical protein